MIFYLLTAILLQEIPSILSLDDLTCNANKYRAENEDEIVFDGIVRVYYERKDLSTYSYGGTDLVNILIEDVKITFDGTYSLPHNPNIIISSVLRTNIEGIASLRDNGTNNIFTQCQLDLKKNVKYSEKLLINIQENIVDMAHKCVYREMCSNFGSTKKNDFIRAKLQPYDFGSTSVMFKEFGNKYYHLITPYLSMQKNENQLQNSVNFIADFILSIIIAQYSRNKNGIFDFPDVHYKFTGGNFTLSNGSFGDLKSIKRKQNVILLNNGLEFSVDIAYEIAEAFIIFQNFTLNFITNVSTKIKVAIESLHLKVKIVINFNLQMCKIEVSQSRVELKKIELKIGADKTVDRILSKVSTEIIAVLRSKLHAFINSKVQEIIKNLTDGLSCEKYRP